MTLVVIVVPVLSRPHRAGPLVESITAATTVPFRVQFVCSPDDVDQRLACVGTGHWAAITDWDPGPGDYALKIRLGAWLNPDADWIFQAADDLVFHPGWDTEALKVADRTGARVIGTNDIGNPRVKRGQHSTHSLIARSYIDEGCTIDRAPGVVLHDGYSHNWVDVELVETARARGEFAFAKNSVVEHQHPLWKKAEWDATYERGFSDYDADRDLWRERSRLVKAERTAAR